MRKRQNNENEPFREFLRRKKRIRHRICIGIYGSIIVFFLVLMINNFLCIRKNEKIVYRPVQGEEIFSVKEGEMIEIRLTDQQNTYGRGMEGIHASGSRLCTYSVGDKTYAVSICEEGKFQKAEEDGTFLIHGQVQKMDSELMEEMQHELIWMDQQEWVPWKMEIIIYNFDYFGSIMCDGILAGIVLICYCFHLIPYKKEIYYRKIEKFLLEHPEITEQDIYEDLTHPAYQKALTIGQKYLLYEGVFHFHLIMNHSICSYEFGSVGNNSYVDVVLEDGSRSMLPCGIMHRKAVDRILRQVCQKKS